MAVGVVTLAGNVSGGPSGARTFGPDVITVLSAVDETLLVTLSTGNNTVTIPTGVTTAVIFPPNHVTPGVPTPNPGYGGTLTLKGVAGDAGVAISVKYPTVLDFDAATLPASFVLNASGAATCSVWFQ